MARADFGGTSSDYVYSRTSGNLLRLAAASLTMWDAETGGTQITDLILNGSMVSTIPVGSDGQIPTFQGPDGVFKLWAGAHLPGSDPVDGERVVLVAQVADLAAQVATDRAAVVTDRTAVEAARDEAETAAEAATAPTVEMVDTAVTERLPKVVASAPLDVPVYDGNPSVGHPDVLYIPGGWHGYTHWMAFTPFPSATRENPSVVASNDGVNWVVPAGLTNPIVPFSALPAGYDWWSDTDMVLSPDGTKLMLYFRGTDSGVTNTCYLTTSTDGVTWTSFVQVVASIEESPAVIVEPGGTFTMFTCGDNTIYRRTSADGLAWSARTAITSRPTLPAPYINVWHVDVVKVGSTYHALVCGNTATGGPDPYRLFHWTSANGLVWTGNATPSVPLTGGRFDKRGHYRSTLQPAASGFPGRFDLWLTCMDDTRTNHNSAIWRIGYIRDFDFSDGETWNFPQPPELLSVRESDERWAMAGEFITYLGTPVSGPTSGWPAKGLRHTASDGVVASWGALPQSWHHYTVEALILNAGAVASAPVTLNSRCDMPATSSAALIPNGQFRSVIVTPAAQNVPKWVDLFNSTVNDPATNYLGQPVRCSISRESWAGANDTFDDTLWVLALRVRRVRDA